MGRAASSCCEVLLRDIYKDPAKGTQNIAHPNTMTFFLTLIQFYSCHGLHLGNAFQIDSLPVASRTCLLLGKGHLI